MQSLVFSGLSKSFGGAPALDDVSLTLRAGRIHALMGENGAGKSTLIKLIAGVIHADRMHAAMDGRKLSLHSPADAAAAGFRFIHQELNIVPQLSVAENVLLGKPAPRRLGVLIDWKGLRDKARAALARLDAGHIDLRAQAGDLSTGDRMLTRIASALVADETGPEPVLYVLDEPTAALTAQESERLFAALDRLKRQGAAILYVSHRLTEVLEICDDVTVLRDGRKVLQAEVAATDRARLIAAMTGKVMADSVPRRDAAHGHDIVLSARAAAGKGIADLTFTLREGEILGLAGLADAGQTEALRLILGAGACTGGEIHLLGGAGATTPAEAWSRGMAYVPRERRTEGLMLGMGARANMLIAHLDDYGWRAQAGAELARTGALAAEVRLRARDLDQPVAELSGGNQQKVVFARALAGRPRLLLLEEPTRGVDVGARSEIHAMIRRASAEGCAVLLASTDLPELVGLSDRFVYLAGGRQVGIEAKSPEFTPADLLARVYSFQTQKVRDT